MLKILGLCAIVFVGVQTHAAAQEPVDLHEMDKIDWSELPEKALRQGSPGAELLAREAW